MRTVTELGLRLVLVALILALVADMVQLASVLVQRYAGVGPSGATPLALLWFALLLSCTIPAYLGFRAFRAGRDEFGAAHAASGRRGTIFFLLGAASAVLYTATGLILGFVYVPDGAYTGNPPSAIPVAVGVVIRGVHAVAPAVIAVFVGLFLIGHIWKLASPQSRVLAAIALLAGVAAPVMWLTSFYLAVPGLTPEGGLTLEALPVVSLALWITAYVLVLRRVRGSAPTVDSTAAPA